MVNAVWDARSPCLVVPRRRGKRSVHAMSVGCTKLPGAGCEVHARNAIVVISCALGNWAGFSNVLASGLNDTPNNT